MYKALLTLFFLLQFGGLSPQLWAQAWDSGVEPTVAYDVTFSGTTTFSGAVSFSGTVSFTGTSALWTADGDTVSIDPGTNLYLQEWRVNGVRKAAIDSAGRMAINTATSPGANALIAGGNIQIQNASAYLYGFLGRAANWTGGEQDDFIFASYRPKLHFSTNNSVVINGTFTSTGFGLGTESPSERLHIDASGGTDGTGRWFANASVTTTDATATTIYTLATTTARMYRLFVNVSANRNDGSAVMATSWSFVVKNVGGTVTELQDAVIGTGFDDSAGVSISGAVSGTDYLIQVTGIAAQTWNWEVSIDATIVAY